MTQEEFIKSLEPALARAFLAAMQDVRDGVDYPALMRAIGAGDVPAAIDALDIEQGSFAPYIAAAFLLYMRTGAEAARGMRVRFDPTRDADFRQDITGKVAAYVDEQVQAARDYVYSGYADGWSRREIAKGLAGKIGPSGKREGGILGLSRAQQSWVDNMRARLESNDPEQMRAAMKYKERNRNFDKTIKRAIMDGKPLSADKIDEITGKFADKLLRKRATDIASFEATQFAAGAREQSVRQALEKARLPDGAVTKTWHHSSIYINARPDHVGMSGQTVTGINTPFVMADGVAMRYAHDPRGGAKHNSHCRCRTSYSINWNYGKVV